MPKKLGIGSGLYEISVRYLGGSDTKVISQIYFTKVGWVIRL